MICKVKAWYETEENVHEMKSWADKGLKIWEERVSAQFPPCAHILDIGCGMGREAFALSRRGFALTGLDISEEAIHQAAELAGEKGYSIPFYVYDGHHFPFADGAFDVVLIWAQTLGLLYGNTYKEEIFSECRRVLAADGLLSFSGHDADFLMGNYHEYVEDGRFYPYRDHTVYWETFRAETMTALAEKSGFTVLSCEKGEIRRPEDGTVLTCLCKK